MLKGIQIELFVQTLVVAGYCLTSFSLGALLAAFWFDVGPFGRRR